MKKADTLKATLANKGADIFLVSDGVPAFITAGVLYRIDLNVSNAGASIHLVSSDSSQELISGPRYEVIEAYMKFVESVPQKKGMVVSRFSQLATVITGVAAIGFILGGMYFKAPENHPSISLSDLSTLMGTTAVIPPIGQLPDIPGTENTVLELVKHLGEEAPLPITPSAKEESPAAPIAISGMLKLPEEVVYENGPSDAALVEETSSFLPPYDPAAYEAAFEQPETTENLTDVKSPEIASQGETNKPVVEEPDNTDAEIKATIEPLDAELENDKNTVTIAPDTNAMDTTQNEAKRVASSLVQQGLTPSSALDVLQQLEALSQADLTEITPEMIGGLPHEVAQLLIEHGLVDMDAQRGDVPYRIIRLPETIVSKYRGKDGISSIPEANSWAATGNNVTVPLPGGGDIKKPEDMLLFGLEP